MRKAKQGPDLSTFTPKVRPDRVRVRVKVRDRGRGTGRGRMPLTLYQP